MNNENNGLSAPTNEEIATYAYYLWESDGRQSGHDVDYWLQAKAHLIADRQFQAGARSRSQINTRQAEKVSVNDALPAEKVARRRKPEGRPMASRESALV